MKSHDNPNRLQPWNITQLAYEMQSDLAQCSSEFERQNAIAMTTREIRELRDTIKASGRNFTPGEMAVMDNLRISY